MRRLVLLPLLAVLAVGCATSPLPDADDPVDNGLRAVWTAFQDAVRTDDTDAIEALVDPDASEYTAALITEVTSADDQFKADILATRAQQLTAQDDGRYLFRQEYTYTDDLGNTTESGYYVYFRVAEDGRAYLAEFQAAG